MGLLALVGGSPVTAAAGVAVCANGSSDDCNPPGATVNPAARYVDPTPPTGFQQCAGFINTPDDDVRWDWENNCLSAKEGPLFLRIRDDLTGEILAGARLVSPRPNCFDPSGRNYRTTDQEGEGFADWVADNPFGDPDCDTGVRFLWHTVETNACNCLRLPEFGMCNDIQAANYAVDKVLFVGGDSTNHDYEAVYGGSPNVNQCGLSAPHRRLRIAIFQFVCGNGILEDFSEDCDEGEANGTTTSCCSVECTFTPSGESCDDENACTLTDACDGAGACVGADDIECPAPPQCHDAGVCDPATGRCSDPISPDGTACDDGNVCTIGDSCGGGVCRTGGQILLDPLADPEQTIECVQDLGGLR